MKVARILVVCGLLAAMMAPLHAEQNQVWTGTLVDASCYLTDSAQTNNDHMGMKSCGTACLKMGRPAGLVTPDKKFFILAVPSPDIAEYAGQNIRVTGKLRSGSILVDKLEVKKGRQLGGGEVQHHDVKTGIIRRLKYPSTRLPAFNMMGCKL